MEIDFKGKKIPIRISYYAIKKFQEDTKKSLSDLGNDLSLIEILVWYAIIAGYKYKGLEMDFKREDVEWLLDESLQQVMGQIGEQQAKPETSKKK